MKIISKPVINIKDIKNDKKIVVCSNRNQCTCSDDYCACS